MFFTKNLLYFFRVGVIRAVYRKLGFILKYCEVSNEKIDKIHFIKYLLKSEIIKKRNKVLIEKQKSFYQRKYNFTDNDWFSPNIPIWQMIFNKINTVEKKLEYLEIGAYEGRSTIFVCENFQNIKVTVVDPYIEYDEMDAVVKNSNMEEVFERFKQNTFNFSERIDIYRNSSEDFFKKNIKKFDIIYIDGSHFYLDVKNDLINSLKIIKKNGIIILDDFIWDHYEKIQENPIGGILPTIQANPNLKIESISNQIILKVKSLT